MMSIRFSAIVWLVIGVFAAFGLYMVKFKVQDLKQEVASAERELREERKNLHVLNAEWTYLNRPARLKQLSDKYLNEPSSSVRQMADFNTLPFHKSVEFARVHAEHAHLPKGGVTLASGVANGR